MNATRRSLTLAFLLPFFVLAMSLPLFAEAPVAVASVAPPPICSDFTCFCGGTTTPPCLSVGRMTGGGFIFDSAGNKVTFGFELHCSTDSHPNNIEVNWNGNDFHLQDYTFAACKDDPSVSPNPPKAGFDTLAANGFGRLNGVPGAFIFLIFQDAGEPGAGSDFVNLVIYYPNGTLAFAISSFLAGGNLQAH